jgi:L-iditol 2-dehydrogenase
VKLLRLDFKDPGFPVSLVDVDEPQLPSPEWALCKVIRGGICGSDLGVVRGGGSSPLMLHYVGFPMELGHEIGAIVTEPGADFPFGRGVRIAVDPVLGCAPRGIRPLCGFCESGRPSCCENLSSKTMTPGFAIGYTNGLGSGWAEMVAVHSSMAYRVPDAVPDAATSLAEPMSVVIHGILDAPPPEESQALVIGCGIIGLFAIAALRYMFPETLIVAVARYPHQAAAAEALGASVVVMGRNQDGSERCQASVIEELAQVSESRLITSGSEAMLSVGFPYVVEAAGTSTSIETALRCTGPRGTLLFLGVAGTTEIDLTPVWLKEISIVGSFCHGYHDHRGGRSSSIELALDMLAAGRVSHKDVISAVFPLEDYRAALAAALDHRDSGSIKIVFDPSAG